MQSKKIRFWDLMSKFERAKHFELIELLKWIEEWKGFGD